MSFAYRFMGKCSAQYLLQSSKGSCGEETQGGPALKAQKADSIGNFIIKTKTKTSAQWRRGFRLYFRCTRGVPQSLWPLCPGLVLIILWGWCHPSRCSGGKWLRHSCPQALTISRGKSGHLYRYSICANLCWWHVLSHISQWTLAFQFPNWLPLGTHIFLFCCCFNKA